MKKIILISISILSLLFVSCTKENNVDEDNIGSQGQEFLVQNAGLVIVNYNFTMLFERLSLTENDQFISESKQVKAVYCLQYLATGLSQAEEDQVTLNKVLCGFDPQDSIGNSVEISDQDKELMDGMLEFVIDYWNVIGTPTLADFRGSWMMREGVLHENENGWELTVVKRPYDILLSKCPYSFMLSKLPWMEKLLYVNWPY